MTTPKQAKDTELEKLFDDVYDMGRSDQLIDTRDYVALKPGVMKKALALIHQATQEAYEQGLIDEAKTCEQAQRHDAKKVINETLDEVLGALPEPMKADPLGDKSFVDGWNVLLVRIKSAITKMKEPK